MPLSAGVASTSEQLQPLHWIGCSGGRKESEQHFGLVGLAGTSLQKRAATWPPVSRGRAWTGRLAQLCSLRAFAQKMLQPVEPYKPSTPASLLLPCLSGTSSHHPQNWCQTLLPRLSGASLQVLPQGLPNFAPNISLKRVLRV